VFVEDNIPEYTPIKRISSLKTEGLGSLDMYFLFLLLSSVGGSASRSLLDEPWVIDNTL
jgi:hypothetical protein